MKKYSNPDIYLKIAVLFFVIDFFAFQKPLPDFVEWLLIVTPLTLLAIAFFLWAYHKQFPFSGNPLFPHFDFNDKSSNIFRATIFGLFFIGLAIMVTVIFLSN